MGHAGRRAFRTAAKPMGYIIGASMWLTLAPFWYIAKGATLGLAYLFRNVDLPTLPAGWSVAMTPLGFRIHRAVETPDLPDRTRVELDQHRRNMARHLAGTRHSDLIPPQRPQAHYSNRR